MLLHNSCLHFIWFNCNKENGQKKHFMFTWFNYFLSFSYIALKEKFFQMWKMKVNRAVIRQIPEPSFTAGTHSKSHGYIQSNCCYYYYHEVVRISFHKRWVYQNEIGPRLPGPSTNADLEKCCSHSLHLWQHYGFMVRTDMEALWILKLRFTECLLCHCSGPPNMAMPFFFL